MRGITQVGATPNRVGIVFELVRASGPDGLDRDLLESTATPDTLTDDPEPDVDNALRHSVSAAEDVGLIRMEDGRYRLNEEPDTSFIAAVERRTLSDPGSIMEPAGWLAGAISWLLCQDPLSPPPFGGSVARNRLRGQLGNDLNFGMTNDSRWQNVAYWARLLGYAERAPFAEEVVVPDPTRALARHLGRLLPPGAEMPLRRCLADLSEISPVLDGGRLRRELEAAAGISHEANAISRSMGLALIRLHQRGCIRLIEKSDGDRIAVDAASSVFATHVAAGAKQ